MLAQGAQLADEKLSCDAANHRRAVCHGAAQRREEWLLRLKLPGVDDGFEFPLAVRKVSPQPPATRHPRNLLREQPWESYCSYGWLDCAISEVLDPTVKSL